MDQKNLIIALALLIVGFILGGALGFMLQLPKDSLQPGNNAAKMEAVVKSLSSNVVPSIVAFGEVSKIGGRNITLTYNEASITIAIKDDAQIYSFSSSGSQSGAAKQTSALFKDIKNGDRVSVNLRVLPDGQLQGYSVIVLNSAN